MFIFLSSYILYFRLFLFLSLSFFSLFLLLLSLCFCCALSFSFLSALFCPLLLFPPFAGFARVVSLLLPEGRPAAAARERAGERPPPLMRRRSEWAGGWGVSPGGEKKLVLGKWRLGHLGYPEGQSQTSLFLYILPSLPPSLHPSALFLSRSLFLSLFFASLCIFPFFSLSFSLLPFLFPSLSRVSTFSLFFSLSFSLVSLFSCYPSLSPPFLLAQPPTAGPGLVATDAFFCSGADITKHCLQRAGRGWCALRRTVLREGPLGFLHVTTVYKTLLHLACLFT